MRTAVGSGPQRLLRLSPLAASVGAAELAGCSTALPPSAPSPAESHRRLRAGLSPSEDPTAPPAAPPLAASVLSGPDVSAAASRSDASPDAEAAASLAGSGRIEASSKATPDAFGDALLPSACSASPSGAASVSMVAGVAAAVTCEQVKACVVLELAAAHL